MAIPFVSASVPAMTASEESSLRSWKIPLVGSVPLLLLWWGLLVLRELPMPRYAPPAGESSVYVPGAGFSGFWYHMGLFQSMTEHAMYQHDYYCYSSACLSVVLGFLQVPVNETYDVCQSMQQEWYRGELSTYDMVDEFLHRLVMPHDEALLEPWLSRVHVISTTTTTGVEIQQATNRAELVKLLQRTTWIPFLTGQNFALRQAAIAAADAVGQHNDGKDDESYYLDGYFSVPLHPPCRYTARVPFTWSMYLNSLNPAVGKDKVFAFVAQGRAQNDNPFHINQNWNATVM